LSATTTTTNVGRRVEVMPLYEYFCGKCNKEVTLTMTISEHGKVAAACPQCGSKEMRPLVSTIFTQTSRKS
jgi:putative FmdB family regulatory protein